MTPSSDLYAALFGASDVAAHLTDAARIQTMLDVEVALAEVEAEIGIIPATCVAPIRDAARAELYDLDVIGADAARDGNLAIPLVRHLTRRVAEANAEAAKYVHWGATSQDIIDTSLVLQLRAAVHLVAAHLHRAAAAAANHSREHIDTPMPGRTWLQQATPVTFGLKAAGWLDAIARAARRMGAALDDALVLQFGGAAGTLAALGSRGQDVAAAIGARLGLAVPDLPWHAHRDRLAHLASSLGVTAGTLGKIGRDLALLAQTEVAEAFEPPGDGRGGSSTMPHKRNPVGASVAIAAAQRAPGLVATILGAMPQEHERGIGGWQAEWETLPELVAVTGGAARAIANALDGLVVDAARMRANLDSTRGLIFAEAISMALAEYVGRAEAHARVEAASRQLLNDARSLADVLGDDPEVTRHLSAADIARRMSPEQYLGAARSMVSKTLERWERDAHHTRGSNA